MSTHFHRIATASRVFFFFTKENVKKKNDIKVLLHVTILHARRNCVGSKTTKQVQRATLHLCLLCNSKAFVAAIVKMVLRNEQSLVT